MAKRRKSSRRKKPKRKRSTKRRRTAKKKSVRRRKSSKRRNPIKRKKSKKRTAKRTGKSSFIDKIPLLKNKTVQKVGFGLGMGALAGILINFIPIPAVKQNAEIIKTGVTFAADPLAGILKISGLLGGGGLNLGNIFGGQTQNGGMPNTVGFA